MHMNQEGSIPMDAPPHMNIQDLVMHAMDKASDSLIPKTVKFDRIVTISPPG